MSKKPASLNDPQAKREAERYDNPIVSREAIIEYLEQKGRAVSFKHLANKFTPKDRERADALKRRLGAMVRDGQLFANRRGSYVIVKQLDLVAGRVDIARDGFGFLVPDEKGRDDIFLPAREVRALMPGDRVLVRPVVNPAQGKTHGVVAEVLERRRTRLVGRYLEEEGICFVSPLDRRIPQDVIVKREDQMPQPGEYVSVELVAQPGKRQQPIGRIVEILGDASLAGMEKEIAIREHGLPHQWPEGMDALLNAMPDTVSSEGRKDFRMQPFVTIDGEDARDFDDAVYVVQGKNGRFTLFVAIADVSHYVKPGTCLDQEAALRTTSVYFPGAVIPMLPERLSNDLCSIKPEVDRYAVIAELEIDAQGQRVSQSFYRGVIRSHARLTYTQVAQVLDSEQQDHAFYPQLKALSALFDVLYAARQERGAIDFETTETCIHFNDVGKIDQIRPVVRNRAHRIIEECMLIANVAVAEFLRAKSAPMLYRVHPTPAQQDIEQLRASLRPLNISLPGQDQPHAKDYCAVLNQAKTRADQKVIQRMVMRSLPPAIYQTQPDNHFGLAYDHYTHFTSPIRRYPDLLIHRALLSAINAGEDPPVADGLAAIGKLCSENERRADLAARDATDWLKCHYLLDKIGQVFHGSIATVTRFGVFVTLDEIYVDGLVHITALKNDYYHYDESQMQLVGRRYGEVYTVGQPLKIRVVGVNLDERSIDFALEA